MNKNISGDSVIDSENFRTNSNLEIDNGIVRIQFVKGSDTHVVSYVVDKHSGSKGIKTRIKLCGWDRVTYLAFGCISSAGFHHVKVPNVAINEVFELDLFFDDLVFSKVNAQLAPVTIEGFKWFIKGIPTEGKGHLEIYSFSVISDEHTAIDIHADIRPDLTALIFQYLKKSFRDCQHDALVYLGSGDCPMPGRKILKWDAESAYPAELTGVSTFRFAWHGLHLPTSLLLYGVEESNLTAVYSAKDLAENWIRHNLIEKSEDAKFAWYDHGTAERLLFFLLLWDCGQKYKFECRFMNLLSGALKAHIRLLNSEAFYAYNQSSRYHNHAWFQDLAVIAAAIAFEHLSESKSWLANAIRRFEGQLKNLIVRDSGFSIFVENSIGYHHGVQRLAECIGQLVEMTCPTSEITKVARELVRWSEFFRYPDDRTPAQGDTFRLAPRSGSELRRGKAFDLPAMHVLETAGYAVIKGNHDNKPYVICILASSLCKTHKHEDNLSFTLWFDGIEWLVDPSFYSYEYNSDLPSYLRSASAHNCISIPDVKYSIAPGKTRIAGVSDSNSYTINSDHFSYENIKVSREFSGELYQLNLKLTECISANTQIYAFLTNHLSENVTVTYNDNDFVLSHPDSNYEILFKFDESFLLQDVSSDKRVVGQTFMQSAHAEVVRHKLNGNKDGSWSIFARKKDVTFLNKDDQSTVVGENKGIDNVCLNDVKVGIVGSCVTRDFISKLNLNSIKYYARTSFISLNAPVVDFPNVELNVSGNFERRMIQADLDKSLYSDFSESNLDCIVIDFIDERFDIVNYSGSFFTKSNYMVSSGFLEFLPDAQFVKRADAHELWFESCSNFCKFLRTLETPIILNKVWWAEYYRDSNTGRIVKFSEHELSIAKENNLYLAKYYDYFLKCLPEAKIIEPNESLIYSDFAHKWGRDFFHFSDEYYLDIANKFCYLTQGFSNRSLFDSDVK